MLEIEEVKIFKKLKKEVIATFLQSNSTETKDVFTWSVQDIANFQEDVFVKTKSTISEKWFYTYFKNEAVKVPRIDMLNILSLYAGYQNWAEFKEKHATKEEIATTSNNHTFKLKIAIGVLATLLFCLIGGYFYIKRENQFRFCFMDDNTNKPIAKPIEVMVFSQNESPYRVKIAKGGCFTWRTKNKDIKLIVQSPYHKSDTIYRTVSNGDTEEIELMTDDYALMIHYYATSNVKDWKKRRYKLRDIIADDALIYEILEENIGVEIYTKEDFIDKLTLPTKTLKNIEIVDTKYSSGKISSLKFKIIPNEIKK